MLPLLSVTLFLALVRGHGVAWHRGMYCLNGTSGVDDQNTYEASTPTFNWTFSEWWMHHYNKCDEFPPAPGDFLELPAGGSFTVEIAPNRGETTFSFGGRYTSEWQDGRQHPEGWSDPECKNYPNLHTQNETMAAGTVFAISYQSDIKKVTPENLVVFTVKYHTPWRRLTTYDVPAGLPACPEEGCHCAWGWVPDHCGADSIYMAPYKCKVTNAVGVLPLATAEPPVWCEDDQTRCVQGAKQMIYWQQIDGNNVVVEGLQMNEEKNPGYNTKMGFLDGAQNDIFNDSISPMKRYERPQGRVAH